MPASTFYSERRERSVVRARGHVSTNPTLHETSPAPFLAHARGKTEVDAEPLPSQPTRIAASDLYLPSLAASSLLIKALDLLKSAVHGLSASIQSANDGDAIQSDLRLQAVRPILRKLFMCRALGDGFGAVVDALISALDNNRGAPLDVPRLEALRDPLAMILREPFITFGTAIKAIEKVESAGFSTTPPGFEQLAEWLTA
jgi:hypothetical protein